MTRSILPFALLWVACGGAISAEDPVADAASGADVVLVDSTGYGGGRAGEGGGTLGGAAGGSVGPAMQDANASEGADVPPEAGLRDVGSSESRIPDGGRADALDSSGRCGIRASQCGFPIVVTNPTISNFDDLSIEMGLGVTLVTPGGRWSVDVGANETRPPLVVESADGDMKTAAHFSGSVTSFADMGASFTPGRSVDASAYSGVTFKLKAGPGNSQGTFRVRLYGVDASVACGLCDWMDVGGACGCFGGHYVVVTLPADGAWHTSTFPFTAFQPTPLGFHASATVYPGALTALVIDVTAGSPFDIWVDDVAFY